MSLQVTTKDTAEALWLAIGCGVVPASDAIAWADQRILASESVHASIIEVALADPKNVGVLADALRAVPGEPNPTAVFYLLLALLDDSCLSTQNGKAVTHLLWQLSLSGYAPDQSVQNQFCGLDDTWDLALQGSWGTVAQAHEALLNFLAVFRTPGLRASILNGTLSTLPTPALRNGAAA